MELLLLCSKNPTGLSVSPISIQQAAEFSIARSSAWKSDEVCSTTWVYDHQVKKSLPGQPNLLPGAFYIVGKKNEIECRSPSLELGILFHVTEECVSRHIEERKMKIDSSVSDFGETDEQELDSNISLLDFDMPPENSQADKKTDRSGNKSS